MKLVYIRHLKCRVIYGMRVRVPLRPPKTVPREQSHASSSLALGTTQKRASLLFFDLVENIWDFLKVLSEEGSGLAVDAGGGGVMKWK